MDQLNQTKPLPAVCEVSNQIKDLISKVRDGCLESRETLANLLFPIVKPIVNKYYIGYHDKASATNYIVAKVFNKIDYFDLEKPVLNYIKLLASNYCIDEYRKKKKRQTKLSHKDNDWLDTCASKHGSDNELTEQDYKDLYSLVTKNDKTLTNIVYDLERSELTKEEIALKYNKTIDDINTISKTCIAKRLRILRKKASSL